MLYTLLSKPASVEELLPATHLQTAPAGERADVAGGARIRDLVRRRHLPSDAGGATHRRAAMSLAGGMPAHGFVSRPVYCARHTASAWCARRVNPAGVHGLLRSIQNLRAAVRAAQPRIYARLEEHRAITRLSLPDLPLPSPSASHSRTRRQASRRPTANPPRSCRRTSAIGVLTTDPIVVASTHPMDPASVRARPGRYRPRSVDAQRVERRSCGP